MISSLVSFVPASGVQQRQIAIFWLVFLFVLGAVVFGLVLRASRRRSAFLTRLDALREVAGNTLSVSDIAAADIERALGTGMVMDADTRRAYDEALALRNRAQIDVGTTASAAALAQANQDAAQALLTMQSIMRQLDIRSQVAGLHRVPAPRCFYCAREDRPPYVEQSIEDGRGNSISVELCSLCQAQLARGRTPQIATACYSQAIVPWYAIPGQSWYFPYGGPTWQYWLPFFLGMDVGGWFDGGWDYASGWRNPVSVVDAVTRD